MNSESLVRRRDRTHAIVEGALLGDIAIVFLLLRAYLPLPVVRTLLKSVAAVPLVMLTQRRGIRLTILAGLASYILFSAFVGPILALSAVDIAVAGILAGAGRRFGLGPALNTLWTGVAYAVLDIIIPTIITVIVFRYPVKDLIDSARHFVQLIFNLVINVLTAAGAPKSTVNTVKGWEGPVTAHWQFVWIGASVILGLLTMYLIVLVAEIVLRQLPETTLERQRAA